jgi:hypothetical protein
MDEIAAIGAGLHWRRALSRKRHAWRDRRPMALSAHQREAARKP